MPQEIDRRRFVTTGAAAGAALTASARGLAAAAAHPAPGAAPAAPAAGLIAARDLLDVEGEVPVASLVATKGLTSEPVRRLLADYAGSAGEALIDYAAMRLLGHERAIAEPELAKVGLKSGQD